MMRNKLKQTNKQNGFTLIEMIVSLAIFAVVVTTAVGALLAVVATNRQLQSEQSIMTNLTFALDSMTREMRTGFSYYCASDSSDSGIFSDSGTAHGAMDTYNSVQDCDSSSNDDFRGVSFVEGGHSITGSGAERILYFFDKGGKVLKRKVGDNTAQSIVSSELEIIEAQFIVTGSEQLSGASGNEIKQPTITIKLAAKDKNDISGKIYQVQTTVTQRVLDI